MDIGPNEQPLTIERFRVRMYRSIRDSGRVPIFPLTALVGSRRSGKTSLLRALAGLDATAPEPYAIRRDWPRGHHSQRRPDHTVCIATFGLGDAARESLARAGTIDSRTTRLAVGRAYDGTLLVDVDDVEDDATFGTTTANGHGSSPTSEALATFVREHLPPVVYVEHDELLPSAAPVEDLAPAVGAEIDPGTAALARLLVRSGLRANGPGGTPDARRVREAGERVRRLLADLGLSSDLGIDVERGRVTIFRASGGRRTPIDRLGPAERYLLTLDVRFAAACSERGCRPLLLLDGPGRAFRSEAAWMRSALERYVRAGATVLYTARLPFDIELQHSEQVLVLAPTSDGPTVAEAGEHARGGLEVRAALGMTGRASFRVAEANLVVEGPSDASLLSALDDLLRRSDEPGLPPAMNVTVAGGSHEVAAVVEFLGRLGLDVVGLVDSDEAGFAAADRFERAREQDERLRRVALLRLADAAELDVAIATIEDLVSTDFYLDAARAVCDAKGAELLRRIAANGERPAFAGKVVGRLGRAFAEAGRRFPKTDVAEALARRISALATVDELPPEMAGIVRRLMRSIRSAADTQRESHDAR